MRIDRDIRPITWWGFAYKFEIDRRYESAKEEKKGRGEKRREKGKEKAIARGRERESTTTTTTFLRGGGMEFAVAARAGTNQEATNKRRGVYYEKYR